MNWFRNIIEIIYSIVWRHQELPYSNLKTNKFSQIPWKFLMTVQKYTSCNAKHFGTSRDLGKFIPKYLCHRNSLQMIQMLVYIE